MPRFAPRVGLRPNAESFGPQQLSPRPPQLKCLAWGTPDEARKGRTAKPVSLSRWHSLQRGGEVGAHYLQQQIIVFLSRSQVDL